MEKRKLLGQLRGKGGMQLPDLQAKVLSEARILKRVSHEHVVHFHHIFETEHELCLVMELVEGGEVSRRSARRPQRVAETTRAFAAPRAAAKRALPSPQLFDYLVENAPLAEPAARAIMQQLLRALQHLHSQGIVHRDLKPENILLRRPSSSGEPPQLKIADFGLAKLVGDAKNTTTFCGTRQYVAPEVRRLRPLHAAGSCPHGPPPAPAPPASRCLRAATLGAATMMRATCGASASSFTSLCAAACLSTRRASEIAEPPPSACARPRLGGRPRCESGGTHAPHLPSLHPCRATRRHEILAGCKREHFSGAVWGGISRSAKQLVLRLLAVDPAERLKVDDALQHPWMLGMGADVLLPARPRPGARLTGCTSRGALAAAKAQALNNEAAPLDDISDASEFDEAEASDELRGVGGKAARRAPPRAEGPAAKLQRTSVGRPPLGHRAATAPGAPPPRATPGLSLLATQRTAEAQAVAQRPMRPEFAASAPGPTLIKKSSEASLFKRSAHKGVGAKRHGGASSSAGGGSGRSAALPIRYGAPATSSGTAVGGAEPAAVAPAPPELGGGKPATS
jgi:serine/threonine protein kinase